MAANDIKPVATLPVFGTGTVPGANADPPAKLRPITAGADARSWEDLPPVVSTTSPPQKWLGTKK
jgi:hypothetical protein